MELSEILKTLEYDNDIPPVEAIKEAMKLREEITPGLLEFLEFTCENAEALPEGHSGVSYAAYLLAYFREPKALEPFLRILSLPGDMPFEILGDIPTQDGHRIIASCYGGDLGPIKALIENPRANEYCRGAGVDSLVDLYVNGVLSRSDVLGYLRWLLQEGLEREPSLAWDSVVSAATDIFPEALLPEIKAAHQEDLWGELLNLDYVHEEMAKGFEQTLQKLQKDPSRQFIGNVLREISWWSLFSDSRQKDRDFLPAPDTSTSERKIGRNDPCPCGSGKKYKKCCLPKSISS